MDASKILLIITKATNSPVYVHSTTRSNSYRSALPQKIKQAETLARVTDLIRVLGAFDEASGGLAKSSEPIPFEYSCQVTSGGKQSHAFPQKTIKMN